RTLSATLFPYTTLFRSEAKYCGHARGDWYEEMMFVHPLDVRCESAFVFSELGEVAPAAGELEAAAQETIARLGLNDPRLVTRRRSEEHTSELQSRENLV